MDDHSESQQSKQQEQEPLASFQASQQGHLQPLQLLIEQDKRTRIMIKKRVKFFQKVYQCMAKIKKREIDSVVRVLIEIIAQNNFLDTLQFRGHGNNQNWRGCYSDGPWSWLLQPHNFEPAITNNPFDLLSICLMIELHQNKIKVEDCLNIYKKLQITFGDVRTRIQIQIASSVVKVISLHLNYVVFIFSSFCLVGVGNVFYNSQQFLKAQLHYLKAIQIRQIEKGYEYLAWINGYWFYRLKQAILYNKRCLKINPINRGALFLQAFLNQNSFIVQRQLSNLALKFNPYFLIYQVLAKLSSQQNDVQMLKVWVEKSLLYCPNYAQAYIRKAKMYRHKFKNMKRQIIKDSFKMGPLTSELYFLCGQIQNTLENSEKAIQYFEKSLQLNPFSFKAMRSLADIYQKKEEQGLCLYYLEQYVELNPYSSSTWNFLGTMYDYDSRQEDAARCYKEALYINPYYYECQLNLGDYYLNQANFQRALPCFQQAYEIRLKHKKGSDIIFYKLALCYFRVQNFEEALKWATKCLQQQAKGHVKVLEILGDLDMMKWKTSSALKYYLTQVSTLQKLNTTSIGYKYLEKVPRWKAIIELRLICLNTQQKQQNLYIFLQAGKLFIDIDELKDAMNCFHVVNYLFKSESDDQSQDDSTVTLELKKVFGDHDKGYELLTQKLTLEALKKQYENLFDQVYQQEAKSTKYL